MDGVLVDYVLVDDYLVRPSEGLLRRGVVLHLDRCISWTRWVWSEPTDIRLVTLRGRKWARKVTERFARYDLDLPDVEALTKTQLRALVADGQTHRVYHHLSQWPFGAKGVLMQ